MRKYIEKFKMFNCITEKHGIRKNSIFKQKKKVLHLEIYPNFIFIEKINCISKNFLYEHLKNEKTFKIYIHIFHNGKNLELKKYLNFYLFKNKNIFEGKMEVFYYNNVFAILKQY